MLLFSSNYEAGTDGFGAFALYVINDDGTGLERVSGRFSHSVHPKCFLVECPNSKWISVLAAAIRCIEVCVNRIEWLRNRPMLAQGIFYSQN